MTLVEWIMCFSTLWVVAHGFNIDLVHPLVFSDPGNATSYFGYKVQYHVTPNSINSPEIKSILVGAPRANATYPEDIQKNAFEPGRLYRCAVDKEGGKGCEEIVVDGGFGCCDKKQGRYPYEVRDNKDSSWLGGTLLVQSPTQGRVVVCSHLLKNNLHPQHQKVTGGCYFSNHTINARENFVKIIPLDNDKWDIASVHGHNLAYYRYGVAGFDAHFTTKISSGPQELIVGAPGVSHYVGTVIRYRDSSTVKVHPNRVRISAGYDDGHDFSEDFVPHVVNTPSLYDFNYFGYSVFSGTFRNKRISYVTGAPRGAESKGTVYIFQFGENESAHLTIEQQLNGKQLGEYFGASLLAMDLNKDGLDDLLVGAPLHTYADTRSFDNGRVYLFINREGKLHSANLEINGNKAPGARFGLAIVSAGDLNQDGYNDILVGAPYENENKGAVYLYHGSSSGIDQKFAQRIGAEQFEPSNLLFRGFGIHMTSFDIDDNGYPDVTVGSYLTNNAVMFRSSPVVHFKLSLTAVPSQVMKTDKPPTIMMSLAYSTPLPKPAKICASFTVLLDVNYKFGSRLKFTNIASGAKYTFEQSLERSLTKCTNLTTAFTQTKVDNSRPIVIHASVELLNNTKQGNGKTPTCTKMYPEVPGSKKIDTARTSKVKDTFCSDCPVLDKDYHTTLLIPFADACGIRACLADLELKSRFIGIPNVTDFVLGSQKTMGIETTVTNHGEPASLAMLLFHLPPNVSMARIPVGCDEIAEKTKVKCSLGGETLREKTTEKIDFLVDLSGVSLKTQFLTFYSEVTTSSDLKESNFTQKASLSIDLHIVADVTVTGHVARDQLTYDRPTKSFSGSLVPFNHLYQVSKYHASSLDSIRIEFDIPMVLIVGDENITFVELYEPWATQDRIPLSCNGPFSSQHSENETLGSETLDTEAEDKEESSRRRRDVNDGKHRFRTKRELIAQTAQQNLSFENQTHFAPINRTSFFNCSMPNVRCGRVTCDASSIENGTQITVFLKAAVNIQALWPYLDKHEIIMISSVGHVKILKPEHARQPDSHKPDVASASTWFYPIQTQAEDSIPLWILIASGIGGLLILLSIGLALAKCGFFKRKRFGDNQQLLEAEQETQPEHERNMSPELELKDF